MRLFISYSRKNKDWVFEFYERLNGTPRHSVWIDRYIPTGHDWWQTILNEIEKSDIFIMVLSPSASESKYCIGELEYAHQLGKPIFPVMLEDCEQPDIIETNRIQFHKVPDPNNMDAVLHEVEVGLYDLKDSQPTKAKNEEPRPSEPSLEAQELYEQATAALEQEDYLAAEARFEQTLEANPPKMLKRLTEGKLADVKQLVERQRDYMEVVQLAKNDLTLDDARRAWEWYIEEHGEDYDPLNLLETYLHNRYRKALQKIEAEKQSGETKLKLSYLTLVVLPPEIGQLTNLTHLYLGVNQLRGLPPEIGQLTNLTELILFMNQINNLPPETIKLTNLRELNLGNNNLNILPPEIMKLPSLTHLLFHGNELSSLPSEIRQLNNIMRLDLSNNNLSSLPPEIGLLINLTDLGLAGNELRDIPSEIGQLTSLTELYLYDNQLTNLPLEIGTLPRLEEFGVVEGNPLTDLPQDVVAGGDDVVLQWLREQAREKGLI